MRHGRGGDVQAGASTAGPTTTVAVAKDRPTDETVSETMCEFVRSTSVLISRPLLTVVIAAGAAIMSAPSAFAADAFIPEGGATASPAFAAPDTSLAAWLQGDGALRVGERLRNSRIYAVPDGCRPSAVGADTVVLTCAAAGRTLAVRVADGQVSSLPVGRLSNDPSNHEFFQPSAVGSVWVYGSMTIDTVIGSRDSYPVLVNRGDGTIVDLKGIYERDALSWGAHRYADLSATSPSRSLCSPVIRSRDSSGGKGRYEWLTRVDRWTLRSRIRGAPLLQRCGSTRSIATGSGAVLGHDAAAWVSGHRIVLRNLRTGRTTRYRYRGVRPQLRFSVSRLVISTNTSVAFVRVAG